MTTLHETPPRPTHMLGALIGFLVLFAALIAGGTVANAGREKLHDPAWTSGAAMAGFLKGTQFKAAKTATNPYPDVLPPVQSLNTAVINGQTRLITSLIPLGEIVVPVAVLLLLCVRFPGSRYAALIASILAAGMHGVYMLEGSSGENTPLLLMWLTVVWLLATMPAAALHHAIDLGAPSGERSSRGTGVTDASAGQWAYFGLVTLVVAGGGALLYGLPVLTAYILAALALTGILALGNKARVASRAEYVAQPAQ